MKLTLWFLALVCALAFVSNGCKRTGLAAPPGGAGGGPGMALAMPVVAVEARRQQVVESVSLVGSLAPDEAIEVKAETDGIVQEVPFEEGQMVEKGALLVRLDDTKLLAELADAQARLQLAEASHTRAKELRETRLISEQEYDQAAFTLAVSRATVELRQRLLRDARVVAPFRGRTGARNVSPGQVITRNTVITWLVDLDPMKVEMNVPERFLGQVQTGQKVQFKVAAYPGREFEGEIYFVAPRLDEITRTALVKTRLPNPEGLLRGGMVANLELNLVIREAAVVIPEAALMSNGDMNFVFLAGPDQTVGLQPVTVGQRLPRWVEITSGLKGGELVIVEGHQKVGPGMKVTLSGPEKAAVYQSNELRPALPAARPATNSAPAGAGKPA
jgi:membrane fusion protein (multidrug efflux system)